MQLSAEELHSLQQTLLEILDDIDSVCRENGISYTLGGGSCLGAVRHQGFIPWDDDIDLNFSRREYTRFVPLFRQRFGWKYWIHTPENTENYPLLFARVRKKGTVVRTRDDFQNEECGAFVDIFIVENTFDGAVLRDFHGLACMATGLLLSCRKFYRDRRELLPLAAGDRALLRAFRVKIALGFLLSWGSVTAWTRFAIRCSALCRNDSSHYVTIPAGRKRFFGELYARADICETADCLYAGRQMKIPWNYEMYLTALYGDYRRIPEEKDREYHSFFGRIQL